MFPADEAIPEPRPASPAEREPRAAPACEGAAGEARRDPPGDEAGGPGGQGDAAGQQQPSANLAEALGRRGIALDESQIASLERYCRRLWRLNEQLNLTRHTTYDKFAGRDVVDSLALAEFLADGERVLDVGTGGGVPGIVLAIVRPDLHLVLLESVAKKAQAVAAMVAELELPVKVVCDGVQQHLFAEQYDTLLVRAVASLPKLLQWVRPHRRRFKRMLLVKGPKWVEERAEARHRQLLRNFALRRLKSYPLEGTSSESVVLEIRPQASLS